MPTIGSSQPSQPERLAMNALQQFSRSEKITAVAGIVLLIGMFAFPWYHVGSPSYTVGGQTFGGYSYSTNVLNGPGSFFSILALIVLIALLAEFGIRRFTSAQLPKLPVSWTAAEMYGAVAVLALLVIKILFHIGNFGWGFYGDLVLAVVLAYGAFGLSRSSSAAQVHASAHGG
jgi:hypothetical protein